MNEYFLINVKIVNKLLPYWKSNLEFIKSINTLIEFTFKNIEKKR